MGIGDWGLGIGPNPQSPIPNPQSPIPIWNYIIYNYKCINLNIIYFNKLIKKMNLTFELDNAPNNINNKENEKDNSNIKVGNDLNKSFSDLTLSDIGVNDKNIIPPYQKINSGQNDNAEMNIAMMNDFNKKGSVESIRLEDFTNLFALKNKIKLTKEDLNNIPLPIFSCIYCSNEKVSFSHFLNETLTNKYLLQTSIYDMKELDKILSYKCLIDKYNENDKLEELIITNTEFINKLYNIEESKKLINDICDDKLFLELYQKKFIKYVNNKLNNIRLKKIQKNMNKAPSMIKKFNQYYSFNNNYMNNFFMNNSNDRIGELNFNNNIKKNIPFINQTSSNLSTSNFNSVSLNNYLDNNFPKEKEKKFKLDDIIEQIEKNSNNNFYGSDSSRKLKKEDIEWETEYYNIWQPQIDQIFYQSVSQKKIAKINKNINKTFIKLEKRNFKSSTKITKDIKQFSKVKYHENEKINESNSYTKNNQRKNKSKEISTDNIKSFKKHSALFLNTNNYKNYKNNVLLNLNKTPLRNYKFKTITLNKNYNSHKNLSELSNNILSKKSHNNINQNLVSLFNSSKSLHKHKYTKHLQKPLNISVINKSTNIKSKTKSKISCSSSVKIGQKDHSNKKTSSSSSSKKYFGTKKLINAQEINNNLKQSQINFNTKYSRNNTFQDANKIKKNSVIINIKNYECYKTFSKNKDSNIETKGNNKNNNNNKKVKNYDIQIKKISKISKTNKNNEKNIFDNKKNCDIKILKKHNIEITIKNFEKKEKKCKK